MAAVAIAPAVDTEAMAEDRQMPGDTRDQLANGVVPAVCASIEQLLAKNPRLALNDVRHLQEWLAKQPHLPPMLDEELVPFLLSNNYSLERAKECVDKCLTMRTHAPELFSGRDPAIPENKAQFQTFRVARLPVRASRNRRLLALGYAPREAFDAVFDGALSLRLSTALMEVVALAEAAEAEAADGGVVLLLDAAHATPTHIACTPLTSLQRLLAFVQDAAPLRVDAVHVLRLGSVGQRALAMLRPFMGAALQKMMHFHSDDLKDMEEFYKEFPRDILPQDFGGTCGTMEEYHQQLVKELESRREWLLAQEKRLVDESKRPGGCSVDSGLFGPQGSFRSLDVD